MRYRVPLLLCALLVFAAAVGAVPAAAEPAPGETRLEVQLQDDGDAEWNVTVAIPIDDGEDREDFEAFAAQFEAGESGLDLGVDTFERAAEAAATESDREMAIQSVTRESEIINETDDGETVDERGLLRVSFIWESFARVEADDTMYVDDAFNTTDGTWLPGLTADQSLTIRSPPGYGSPTTSPIGAADQDLHWEGPQTFEPGYFTVVYSPTSTGPAPVESNGIETTLVVIAVGLSGSALLVGLYLLVARRRSDGGTVADDRSTGGVSGASGAPADGEGKDNPPTADTDGSRNSVAVTGGGAEAEADPEPDPELLSDEERVEQLLDRNGGRMKQATIVKETGWSNAKVSQLLSSMDDDDRVDKLRIGRENLISLPGEGVGDIESRPDEE